MTRSVSLIIPTYRNPQYLDLCLRSAVECRRNPSNGIIVVVDGFVDESRHVIAKYEGIQGIYFTQNMGMQYAINAGVMQATTKYVLVINDDNVLPKHWDTRGLEEIDKVENLGHDRWVMTVDQVEPTGPGMFEFDTRDFGQSAQSFQYESWLTFEEQHSRNGSIAQNGHIFPFIIQKKYFLAIGGLDTYYGSPNVCDWDFFLKLELLGFSFPRTHALHLYHFGSVATKKNAEAQRFREREAKAFAEFEWKWGAKPYNAPGTNSKVNPGGFRGF